MLGANGVYRASDTLRALDVVRISGRIAPRTNTDLTNEAFDGVITVEVLDKPVVSSTLGSGNENPMPFLQRNSVIHRGRARVRSGRFVLSWVMPKDMVYQNGIGKLSADARSEQTDAHGANLSLIIGG